MMNKGKYDVGVSSTELSAEYLLNEQLKGVLI